MSDVVTARDDTLRASLLIAYGLYLLALFTGGITALAGVILVYIRRAEARGTLWESHCRNLISVFWITIVAAALMTAITFGVSGGFILSLYHNNGDLKSEEFWLIALLMMGLGLGVLVFTIFYLYRTLRGFIRALEGQPY